MSKPAKLSSVGLDVVTGVQRVDAVAGPATGAAAPAATPAATPAGTAAGTSAGTGAATHAAATAASSAATPAAGSRRSLRALSDVLGVVIDDNLLTLALTHRSHAYENGGGPNNERLEFLGDSILGQAVTVMLYNAHSDIDEGQLAKRRAGLVSTVALAEIARHIGLGIHIKLGRGEELTGGRDKSSILADTVEAIIGATYLSLGGEVATALVLRLIQPLLDDPDRFGAAMDPKTSLQELAAARGLGVPVYVMSNTGPDHSKKFTAVVELDSVAVATGSGSSKKHAEMAAALDAFTALQREES